MTDTERDELTVIIADMDRRERRLASRRRQAEKRANPQPPKTWADIRERKKPIAYARQMLSIGSLRNEKKRKNDITEICVPDEKT